MTRGEIIIQIISEVSGKSKSEFSDLLSSVPKNKSLGKWDEEISEKEAQKLINELRSDSSGILAWLVRGAMAVNRNKGRA